MKISYFLYSLLTSIWIFSDSRNHNVSRWWAIGTFILPVLVPYYLVKTRPHKKYWKYIGIWVLGFTLFFVVESVFIRNESAGKTPVIEELKSLCFKIGSSAGKTQDVLQKLDEIQDIGTIPKINEALRLIDLAQTLLIQVDIDSNNLIAYIEKHRDELRKKDTEVFIQLEGLYRDKTYFIYNEAVKDYLNSYAAMLTYCRGNFNSISAGKLPQKQNYEKLYFKYRNAVEKHNKAYIEKMGFHQEYLASHPNLNRLLK